MCVVVQLAKLARKAGVARAFSRQGVSTAALAANHERHANEINAAPAVSSTAASDGAHGGAHVAADARQPTGRGATEQRRAAEAAVLATPTEEHCLRYNPFGTDNQVPAPANELPSSPSELPSSPLFFT